MARTKSKLKALLSEALEFFKYNPETDGEQTFNIDLALNQNWDKVKEEFVRQETEIEAVKDQVENIDVSWDGITGKPEAFPPSEHDHDDRYYTESEINTKLNGKANSTHTHTKSEITDFPTSLPANGGNADTVDGLHASDLIKVNGNSNMAITNTYPVITFVNTTDNSKANLITASNAFWVEGWTGGQVTARINFNLQTGELLIGNANFAVMSEINSLKSTVVSGKQLVVNAINDKLGYASGLTTSHSFSDYDWWIRYKISNATINYDTAIAALKLYYSSTGYLTISGGGTTTVSEDGYVFVMKSVASTWTCVSGSMVRFSAGETHPSMGSSTYCYKVAAGTVIKNGASNGQYIYVATQSTIRSLMGVTIR